jgi:hypothetical protein
LAPCHPLSNASTENDAIAISARLVMMRAGMKTSAAALSVLTISTLAILAACGEQSASIGAPPLPPPSPSSRAAPAAADAGGPSPAMHEAPPVAGRVVDDAGQPIVGRPVSLVDARGSRKDVLTDEGGTFHVADVVAPYDVSFAPAPSGTIVVPVAYLGLGRRDPSFVLGERDGTLAPPPHLVRLSVALPACAADKCWMTVATTSRHGAGAASRSYRPGETSAAFEIDHGWSVDDLQTVEPIDVHVLAGDEGWSQFAYGQASGIDGTPGEATDVLVSPSAIEATAPMTISTAGPAIPPGWEYFVAMRLILPGGSAPMTFRIAAGSALVVRLPRLEGAGFDVMAWAQHPVVADRPWLVRSVTAWSGALPLTTSQVLLDLPVGIDITRPSADGTLARRGAGIAWTPSHPGLVTVGLTDTSKNRRDFQIHTSESALSFASLDRLGLARPSLGEHVLEVASRIDSDVDALTDPAHSPGGARTAGGSAFQRFAITMTP